jgi:cell division transport system permease protein
MTFILKEASAALRRTPIMSVMTAIVIAVCLGLAGILAMLTNRANDSLEEFRASLIIEAFFEPSVPSEDAQLTVERSISHQPAITSLVFISKEHALADYEKNSGEDVQGILGYNPLPASVRLTFSKLTSANAKSLKEQLSKVEGIKDIRYDERSLINLEKRSQTLSMLALALGAVLLIVSLTIVISTIRLAIEAREDTIHAMQLLGAGQGTIIFPYIIEGALAGFAGGLLSGGLILLFHFFVIPPIAPELVTSISGPKQYGFIFGTGGILGMVIGIIGSFLAVWRISRK